MAAHTHHHSEEPGMKQPIAKAHTKPIWRTFWILVILTAIEFAFAFMMESGSLRNAIFIILTIFKAFFIVAEFMHLKHETKTLIWSIMIPFVLLVWLVVALLSEGSFYYDSIFNYFTQP